MSDKKKLIKFGRDHFKYINTLFGNLSIRRLIKNTKSFQTEQNKDLLFVAETSDDFSGDMHHVLYKRVSEKKSKKLFFCSVNTDFVQDIEKHPNDTLCQSYTLLKYMKNRLPKGFTKKKMIQRQMSMVRMYREMIANKEFTNKLIRFFKSKVILGEDGKPEIEGDWMGDVAPKVVDVLDRWEEYGYSYFMYDGEKIIKK